MRTFIKRALLGSLLAGGITLAGAAGAHAAETDGENGLLSGTQGLVDIAVPVEIAGNAISVLGDSHAAQPASAPAAPAPAPAPAPAAPATPEATTDGSDGIASGSQAVVSIAIPVAVEDTSVSVVGDSSAAGDSAPTAGSAAPTASPAAATTDGSDSILGGTQALIGLDVPVMVGGNAVSVVGDSSSEGAPAPAAAPVGSGSGSGSDAATTGEDGVLSGTQVVPDISAPITVGGNAISVLGDSSSTTTGGTATPGSTGTTPTAATTDGEDSTLGGTQVIADVFAPITATGNAISVLGDSSSTTTGSSAPVGTPTGSASTGGLDGLLGGTQLVTGVAAPVTIGGNAVSVVGDSTTSGPGAPAVPAVPTVPTNPVDPVDPAPVAPTAPITGDDSAVTVSGMSTGSAASGTVSGMSTGSAASGTVVGSITATEVSALAGTGSTFPVAALLLALAALALGGALVARRRQA